MKATIFVAIECTDKYSPQTGIASTAFEYSAEASGIRDIGGILRFPGSSENEAGRQAYTTPAPRSYAFPSALCHHSSRCAAVYEPKVATTTKLRERSDRSKHSKARSTKKCIQVIMNDGIS
jgi:hypothetical protein